MNEEELIKYYNKFNEDKRLTTKHGSIEFKTAMYYITKYVKSGKVIDIGAGTGKYSLELNGLGYDVTAVELVKHNLRVIESKNTTIKCYQGNALDLASFKDNTYDLVLLFGPMYHLISFTDKLKALEEAKRICKPNGLIMISYCMNEYAIIEHGFIDNNIETALKNKNISKDFKVISKPHDLYSFMRLKDINKLKNTCHLKRVKIVAQDGPTEYLKKTINKMTEKELNLYFTYHLKTCEYKELLGASRHVLDILKKIDGI
jgi:ubiquinone/menaquinone biosynthesis C-methylase UbiE